MNNKHSEQESFRTFQLMNEIESGAIVSQRELANRLGIAVGLVNSYLKNFVSKGFMRVKCYPRNRYGYLLTPAGIAEKSRLAYEHLNYFNTLYRTARRDYAELFATLSNQKIENVAFCGVDEVAEIALFSLRETSIKLECVFAEGQKGEEFFQHTIKPFEEVIEWTHGPVVVTAAKDRERLFKRVQSLNPSVSIYCPGIMSARQIFEEST